MKEEEQERDGVNKRTVVRKARRYLIEAASEPQYSSNLEAERVPFRKRSMLLLVTKLFGINNAIPALVYA